MCGFFHEWIQNKERNDRLFESLESRFMDIPKTFKAVLQKNIVEEHDSNWIPLVAYKKDACFTKVDFSLHPLMDHCSLFRFKLSGNVIHFKASDCKDLCIKVLFPSHSNSCIIDFHY